ncbi:MULTISPECIES: helix-turn-helix domain-containing protein [unclassified Hyphomicrobium]|uniref:helix-turn-helix domain-containing protein n=1 Tax=unclassified Hyphomicrobium TaxID=2619925 RepID=UPI000213D3A3|nr:MULTISPECIES: helix-turn-helix domain-containing protein [unclassified Hyphomicrobium]CCB66240.1 Transcriptional regulator, AraC family [Hyphomicrobium sp. MC1]
MSSELESAFPRTDDRLQVWDSQYGVRAEAFTHFRETICSAFMPWTPEYSGRDFVGRVESVTLSHGAVGRVRMSPIVATKTKSNIANSPIDCVHANLIISGELKVDQGGETKIAKRGDLVLYESFSAVILTEKPEVPCDNLALVVPMQEFSRLESIGGRPFSNVLISSEKLGAPLSACLTMLAQSLCSSPVEELDGLLKACIALLPISMGLFETNVKEVGSKNYFLKKLLDYIDHNLSDPDLSPLKVAQQFGISIRYVHKLFGQFGSTFGTHVTSERLKRIRWDLQVSSGRRPSISSLAYRWGFNDLSTFHRAFKKQFGCTPGNALDVEALPLPSYSKE